MRPARYWGYPESCSAEDILTPGERTMKDPDWQTSHNSLTIPSQDQFLPISASTFNSEDNQSLKSIKYLLKIVDCLSRTNFSTNEVREGREGGECPHLKTILTDHYWLHTGPVIVLTRKNITLQRLRFNPAPRLDLSVILLNVLVEVPGKVQVKVELEVRVIFVFGLISAGGSQDLRWSDNQSQQLQKVTTVGTLPGSHYWI